MSTPQKDKLVQLKQPQPPQRLLLLCMPPRFRIGFASARMRSTLRCPTPRKRPWAFGSRWWTRVDRGDVGQTEVLLPLHLREVLLPLCLQVAAMSRAKALNQVVAVSRRTEGNSLILYNYANETSLPHSLDPG
jgi:hypothetical protein